MKRECMGDAFSAQIDQHGESSNAPVYAAVKATTAAPLSAGGALSDFWARRGNPPAVIVNREAPPEALLSWCLGELTALRGIVNVLVREESIDPEGLYEMVGHHLEPLPNVLEAAIALLSADSKTKGGAA